jgi:peptidoglycan-N-acetylglucosamine deacetylase
MLDVLAQRGAKATLFLTGAWAQARPDTARRAVAEGHELGNHNWGHPWLTRGYGFQGTLGEIRRADAALAAVTGAPAIPASRPPYGAWDAAVLQAVAATGRDLYLWDVDSGGYRPGASAAGATSVVLTGARSGSIIVMHPLTAADRGALGAVIGGLRARGLEPGRLSDLLFSTTG